MRLDSIYISHVVSQIPRLLSHLDRESCSVTSGSFDREHWGWKFRDFPLGMLQTSVYPLAMLWRHAFPQNPYYGNPVLLEWILNVIKETIARQHSNGAFDGFCPNEQDAGPTLGVMHGLTKAFRLVGETIPSREQARFLDGLRKACDFSISRDENHGFVSNHLALFAVTFLDACELLGEEKYRKRGDELVGKVLFQQSSDGWYREYDGPDPGYESLGIFHLASYWQRTGSTHVLDSLRRSIDFYAHCVHPDGSVGGVYGSRYTSLYFPGGFESLAREIPMAATIARFMRKRLGLRNVVTPAVSDAENLPSLMYTYLEACLASVTENQSDVPPLPCEEMDGVRHFPHSGITVAGATGYYAVVNSNKGGVCRIFDKSKEKIAYEDAGYLVRAAGVRWSSQLIGLGKRIDPSQANEVVATAAFGKVREELPTPSKFILLRLLNLTLFRSLAVGNWLRRLIVERLITRKRPGPIRLIRRVTFEPDEIWFCDRLEAMRPMQVEEVSLPRSFTAIHMGSAKYFHPSELEKTPLAPVNGMASELSRGGVAEVRFTLRFPRGATSGLLLETKLGDANGPRAGAITHQ